jgi:hypothetical protein
MEKRIRLRILGSIAVAAALALPTGSALAAGPGSTAYTCAGGAIPSGNYASITVTGFCGVVPDAVITVTGNLDVAAGAVLDGQSAPFTLTVGHNVTAATGSILALGCQPSNSIGRFAGVPCAADPTGQTTITVNGNVTATDADTVILRKVTVNGNVTLSGGGGDIPWSIKGMSIAGNLTISGVTADWLGLQFSWIAGNATLTNITALDPGDPGRAVFVVQNTVGRNLICMGLAPGVSPGLFPGEHNTVGGKAIGQCAALV